MSNRTLYFSIWILVVLFTSLSEAAILPTGYIEVTPKLEYFCHIFCIVFTLSETFTALRLMNFKIVKLQLKKAPASIERFNLIRILLLASAIFFNLIIYYALASSATPGFCLLLTLVGFVFCYPLYPDTLASEETPADENQQ